MVLTFERCEAYDQTCAGQPAGAICCIEISRLAGCYVWNPNRQPGATVTWTGECAGGFAHGMGTLTWVWDGNRQTATGRLQGGRRNGHWVFRYSNGDVQEGPMADDIPNGHWVPPLRRRQLWEGQTWTASGMVTGSSASRTGKLRKARSWASGAASGSCGDRMARRRCRCRHWGGVRTTGYPGAVAFAWLARASSRAAARPCKGGHNA